MGLRIWVVIVALIVLANGCALLRSGGSGEKAPKETPRLLALKGAESMKKKDYDDALEAFKRLKERYPYSKYALLADLNIGDAYFHKKEYDAAVSAYEEFARLHPRNEAIPYVFYQIGMCHFLSFKSIDRDLEGTYKAIDSFNRLLRSYPNSSYATKARLRLSECKKRLAAHELYAARIYYKMGKCRAALLTLEALRKNYPQAARELGYNEKIRRLSEACRVCVEKGSSKPSLWSRLGF